MEPRPIGSPLAYLLSAVVAIMPASSRHRPLRTHNRRGQ